jgi:hypothetical protein
MILFLLQASGPKGVEHCVQIMNPGEPAISPIQEALSTTQVRD